MKLKPNLWMLTLAMLVSATFLSAQTPVEVYHSTAGKQYYRIPALAICNNGDLLFFNDDRHSSSNDVGSNTSGISQLMKRLTWNGSVYASTSSIAEGTNGTLISPTDRLCYGDPAVVADRESSNVLVLVIGGSDGAASNKTSFAIKSTNNGASWSAPVQLTLPGATDNSNVSGFFFASGRILQSKVIKKQGASFYRIYSSILAWENGAKVNKVFYSDDFGTTWNLLGNGNAQISADEAKLEELPNGDLILATRYGTGPSGNYGGRYFNRFTYTNTETAVGSWGNYGLGYQFTAGATINGEMLTVTAQRKSDNQQVTLLLLSTATGQRRRDIKVFRHEIDNNTTASSLTSGWTPSSITLPVTDNGGYGSYSAMAMQADNKIGIYYEGHPSDNTYYNLYYITYTLEQLTDNAYTLTNPTTGEPDIEVPDGVVPVYEWQGVNSNWNDPQNWRVVNAVNNTPLARDMVPVIPDANGNVVISAPAAGAYNPVLIAPQTVNNLYVAPGAAIGNQYYLQVSNKVYTDVEIPTNQWVRVSMPLKDTYSGDMFTTAQGGVEPADEFTAARYSPTDAHYWNNGGNNRVFPYAIYQRVFSDAVNQMLDDQTGTEAQQLNTAWSLPYNDLAARYQVAEGLDLWAPSTEATATFRFPSSTDTYDYYYNDGTRSPRQETVDHTASGKMAYGNTAKGVMTTTVVRAKRDNEGAVGEGVPMYAVGNPAFSYLNIAEFIKINAYGADSDSSNIVGNITPYAYKYNEGQDLNGGEASETIYYLTSDNHLYQVSATAVDINDVPTHNSETPVSDVYVAPTRGFRVMAGSAEVSTVEPKLIGMFKEAAVHQAAVPFYDNENQTGTQGYNVVNYSAYNWINSTNTTNGKNGDATFSLAISTGDTPEEVLFENFCGMATCKGIVDPINRTITIKGGDVVSFYGKAMWPSCDSAKVDGRILGCADKNLTYSFVNMRGKSIGYANNVSDTIDIIIDYSIEPNTTTGKEEMHLELRNAFAIYSTQINNDNGAGLFATNSQTSVNDGVYYNAFDCFDSMTASMELLTDESTYICPEMFGTYRMDISGNNNVTTGMPGGSFAAGTQVKFQVLPIEGIYNVVRICGLYPTAASDTNAQEVTGVIEEVVGNPNQYLLTIVGGQAVYGAGDLKNNMWFVYGNCHNASAPVTNLGQRVDLVLCFDKSNATKYFTWGPEPVIPREPGAKKWTSIQISEQNSSPRGNSLGFRAYPVTISGSISGFPKVEDWSGNTGTGSSTVGPFTVGTTYEAINLKFTSNMFEANPSTTRTPASTPRKTAAQGGAVASVKLTNGNRTANTIITRRNNASNGYNAFEDASVIDIDNTSAKLLASLAGKQVVAVNTLGDTTAVQLYISNVNGNVTLSFDNIAALGNNARLVDNATGVQTPLNGRHQDLTLNMSVNDSPLRYSITWDVISGDEAVELPVDGDAWFQALSTAKGTIKVVSNSEMSSVRLFDATGKLVASRLNPSTEAWFEYLLSGVYVIEASNGVETSSIKVNVK